MSDRQGHCSISRVLSCAVALCWLHLLPGSRLACPAVFVLMSALEEACVCISAIPLTQLKAQHELWMWLMLNKLVFCNFLKLNLSCLINIATVPLVFVLNEDKKPRCHFHTTAQIDVSFLLNWLSGSWEMLCYVPDERMKAAFIRCQAIWESDVIDAGSLFEYDGALLRLYFQPSLYLMGEQWDKEGFQAAVVWAFSLHLLPA